jgi:hypothetical protein
MDVILQSCDNVADPTYHFDAEAVFLFDADPDLVLMKMRIRLFTLMLIRILPSK